MKIRGQKISPPKPIPHIFPREDGDLKFICGPVLNYDEFKKIYPEPVPPMITKPGQKPRPDLQNSVYLKALDKRAEAQTIYMFIKSISFTPDLEWETVDINSPDTWDNWRDELAEFLTDPEINQLASTIMDANMPSEIRQKEALDRFARSQEEGDPLSKSLKEELGITPSGEPANVSD